MRENFSIQSHIHRPSFSQLESIEPRNHSVVHSRAREGLHFWPFLVQSPVSSFALQSYALDCTYNSYFFSSSKYQLDPPPFS